MSEQDRFDWSDDADFESLADEPIEGFTDFDDSSDFRDMADDGSSAEAEAEPKGKEAEATDVAVSESESAADKKKRPGSVAGRRGRGISSGGLGFIFTASILAATAGIGSACLLAVGVDPASLWQPEKFLAWENYLNLQNNPLNILALICLGIVTLTLLGSGAIARAASGANSRTRAAEEMLDRITSLRLENEAAWQDPAFKTFDPAATFVSETLGAWRLQAARQKHLASLEGELQSLEKALANNSREDLSGCFDSPIAGALSDEMIRYFDERASLSGELSESREKDQDRAAAIVKILQDARRWHNGSGQNMGQQGAAMDRLAGRLDDFATALAQTPGNGDPRDVFTDFKAELDRIVTSNTDLPNPVAVLTELVDRGSKLAFQIAMEVARLGPRGERLVPMSQSLEDLTTDFRKITNQFGGDGDVDKARAEDLQQLTGKLAGLGAAVQSANNDDRQERLRQFGLEAGQLARNLADMVQSYVPQTNRLVSLGTSFSDFSGVDFEAYIPGLGSQENPPAGSLSVAGQASFTSESDGHSESDGRNEGDGHNEDSIHKPADVDPFMVTPPAKVAETPGDPSFTSSVGEAAADIFGSGLDSTKLTDLEIETSFGGRAAAAPDDVVVENTDEAEDEVFDLSDFAAEPVATEEPVHDLSDFAAEPVATEEPVHDLSDFAAEPVATEEPVYDLSDFAAEPVAAEEPVYDLSELGGLPLDGIEDEVEEPEEEIFGLETFGAVPLN